MVPLGIGSALDATLATHLNNLRTRRAAAFFGELERRGCLVPAEWMEKEEVLHAALLALRTALNTHLHEKIEQFARLFDGYARYRIVESVDEYEEMLRVLDDLSMREFNALLILHDLSEKTPRQPNENDLQWVSRFWEDFAKRVEQEVGVPREELGGFLARLNRTGLYQTIVGAFYDYHGDKRTPTPLLSRFLDVLQSDP